MIHSISVIDLKKKLEESNELLLIDVREFFEREIFNIGGLHIPMQSVFQRVTEIPTDKPVVLYCQKGIRSLIIIQRLNEKFGYDNLINLKGGMYEWQKLIQTDNDTQ